MADINDLKELLGGGNSSSNKMEVKTFTGGMNKNGSELYLQGTEYRHAKNFVNKGDGRDLFSMVNERGTLEIDAVLPTGFSVIGYFVLGSDIIVALADDSGNSQIGVIDADNVYSRKVPTDTNINNELGFSKDRPVDIEARKLFTGERVVYFTDYPKNFGSVSLDNPPATGDITDNIKAVPNISIPSVRLDVIKEDSGALNVGVYQFIARYKTESLNATTFGVPSNVIPIVDNKVTEGRDAYDGEYFDFGNVSKSIRLAIENIDTSFPYLEVVVIRRTGSLNTFVAEALPLINITSSEILFTYNGTESDRTPMSLEELRAEGITYESAKNVMQKDGVLFYSNLVDGGRKFDDELQSIANNIEVYYEIEEIPYGDSRFGVTSIPFGLYSEPYIKDATSVTGDEKIIVLKFNKAVDQSTLTVLSNFSLDVLGTNVSFELPVSSTLVGLDSVELTFLSTPTGASKIEIINIEDNSNNETYDSTGYIPIYASIITTESNVLTEDSFLDYKNEQMTHYKKTYRRGEVYSLSFDVSFNNGNQTLCFHIPGNNKLATVTEDADTITKKLGTYVSTKEYPPNQGYPGADPEYDQSFSSVDKFIRHHKMPTIEQEPHYINDGNGVLIRLIKLKFKFNEAIPPHIAKEIQSITIRRERRNTIENRSVLAQGIVHQYIKTSSDINADGDSLNTIYKKMPFFNNTILNRGVDSNTAKFSAAFTYIGSNRDKMAFHSPDTDLIEFNPNDAIGAMIKPVAKIVGKKSIVKRNNSRTLSEFFGLWGESNYNKYIVLWMQAIYDNITTTTDVGIDIVKSNFIAQNTISQPDGLDFKLDNQSTSRHLFLKTSSQLASGNSTPLTIVLNTDLSYGVSNRDNYDNVSFVEQNENNLYNIEINNTSQYGEVGNSEYISCLTSNVLPLNAGDEIQDVFGGDTFIGAYAVRNCDIYYYRGLSRSYLPDDTNISSGYYDNTSTQVGAIQKGADFRSFSYFIVESYVNTEYRHKYIDRTDEDNPISEPTYFPNSSAQDVLNVQVQEGDSRGYNTLYSYEDTIKVNFTRGNTESAAGNYETRIIYSDKAFETERRDSFKVFPVNNFHDLPKHTGPIMNTFVHANTLFSHTPKALWRHYVGDVVREATSIGDIVMGPGGMFTNPSKMVVDSTGGYGGCVNKYGCIETPFGFFFPDLLQNKMFILLGEKLEDIGVSTMSSFFEKKMNVDMFTGSVVNDNPFSGIGYSAGYDPLLNRVIISKVSGESSFTYSYSFYSGKFISEHDYIGSCYINRDLNMYSFIPDNTSMWHHNKGDYGSFYGNLYPSSITVEFVEEPFYEKVFDNVVVKSKSFNNDKRIELDTFNSCDFYTKNRRSGEIGLVVGNKFPMTLPNDQRKITFTKDKYHMSIPLDAVMDYGNDIFNNSNIDFNKMFKTRLKGSSLFTTFTYDNNDNYKFVLDLIGISYRINHG